MFTKKNLVQALAVAGLVAATGASQAAITVYTSLAAFTAAVTAPGTDTFAGFSITGSTPGPLTRTAGAYGYTVDTDPTSTFFGAGTTANPWLSTNTATDTFTFGSFTGGVGAFGGNFFGSDIAGSFAAGDMTISVTDSSGVTTSTIVSATTSSFLGFVSDTGVITAATAASVQPLAGFLWPTVDNLVLAGVAPIPEPGTYALLLAGLGLVGFMARRRS